MEKKKVALLIVCFVEMKFFTLIIFGFNSLSSVYKSLGIFSQICDTDKTNSSSINTTFRTCNEQDLFYGNIFVIWVSFRSAMAIPGGLMFDYLGIQLSKAFSSIIFAIGCFLFGLVQFNSWLLIPAGCLTAFGALIISVSNISLADNFGTHKNLVISIESGLMVSSMLVFVVIKILYSKGVQLYISFTVLSALSFIVIFGSTYFLLPYFIKPIYLAKTESSLEISIQANLACATTHEDLATEISVRKQEFLLKTFPTIWKAFSSRKYILNMIFVSMTLYRIIFFLSQMGSQLIYLFKSDLSTIEKLQFHSNIVFSLGILSSIFSGFLIDFLSKQANLKIVNLYLVEPPEKLFQLHDKVYIIPSVICALSLLIPSFLIDIPNQSVFYLVFFFFCIGRSFNACLIGSFTLSTFPKQYFGTLLGITILFCGIINLTQIYFNKLATPNKFPKEINYAMISCSILAFLHPINLYFY